MARANPTYSPSVRRRRLGRHLRRLRDDAGFTMAHVSERLGWAKAKVGKLETSELKTVKPGDLDSLLTLYNVEENEQREALHQLARDAKQKGWWWKYRDVFGAESLPDFETEANLIRTYQVAIVPGLLQTPEYAEGVFLGGRYTSPDKIKRQVDARMERREILTRYEAPPRLVAVIDEAALRRPMGDWSVMTGQFEYLLRIGQLPNIDIQILPFSAGPHASLGMSFTLLDFPDPLDAPIAYTDSVASGVFEETEAELERYTATFGELQGAALSTVQSARFIEDILSEESD